MTSWRTRRTATYYILLQQNGKRKFEMNTDMGVPAKCPLLAEKETPILLLCDIYRTADY
jgi:hypothetical protein